ncbi:MAG: hypothetical protein QNL62_21050 [Gammaproteobacteria bacterium]|nr:hypothetical protein [Gammaproteobacteria bacterium]
MEFFKEVKIHKINTKHLKKLLTIKTLPELCQSIDTVILDNHNNGQIYCLWGEFSINREELKDGVRFSLPNCPNALAWTITLDADIDTILIHCTINKRVHDKDFVESIEQFIIDWSHGIELHLH